MNFTKALCYDLHQGLLRRWYLYVPVVVFCIGLCVEITIQATDYQHLDIRSFTAGNFLAVLFEGIDEYIPSPVDPFKLPLNWFLLRIYPICLISDHIVHDLKGTGQMVLLKTGSRRSWWASKIVWMMLMLSLYEILLVACTLGFSAVVGKLSLLPDREILAYFFGWDFASQNTWDLLLSIYGLPWLAVLTSGILHLLFSLVLSPFFSALLLCVLDLAAAYFMVPFLPGEYTMLLRHYQVAANGFSPSAGVILCTAILFAGITIGTVYFDRYDILYKKEV